MASYVVVDGKPIELKANQPIATLSVVGEMLNGTSAAVLLEGEELAFVRENFKNLPGVPFQKQVIYTGDFAKFILANWAD